MVSAGRLSRDERAGRLKADSARRLEVKKRSAQCDAERMGGFLVKTGKSGRL